VNSWFKHDIHTVDGVQQSELRSGEYPVSENESWEGWSGKWATECKV